MKQLIKQLRAAYAPMQRMDDSGYRKLTAILDRANDATLKVLANEKINFVSALAANRCFTRGIEL